MRPYLSLPLVLLCGLASPSAAADACSGHNAAGYAASASSAPVLAPGAGSCGP